VKVRGVYFNPRKAYFQSQRGRVYHEVADCPAIRNSQNVEELPGHHVGEVLEAGGRPCKRCAGVR